MTGSRPLTDLVSCIAAQSEFELTSVDRLEEPLEREFDYVFLWQLGDATFRLAYEPFVKSPIDRRV